MKMTLLKFPRQWLPHGGARSRVLASTALVLSTALALQGCELPRSGPLLKEVDSAASAGDIVLVQATPDLARASRRPDRAGFPPSFASTATFEFDRLARGDGVQVTIWERDDLAVFAPAANGATSLGELVIDPSGNLTLPFVGKISAEGLTPAQLREAIMRRMSRLMASFEVAVQPTDRRGRIVTAQGALAKPGVYPFAPDTARLGGLLGLAGPDQTNPEQSLVTVRRNGIEGSVRLADIYRDPATDIALRDGDSVIVHPLVEQLTVLGASGLQSRVLLTRRNYTLMDALGDSHGLNDTLANPRAVFLMPRPAASADARPVVYQFDFTQPAQIALAGQFAVHDGDAIVLSDAPFTQVQKVLAALSTAISRSTTVISQ